MRGREGGAEGKGTGRDGTGREGRGRVSGFLLSRPGNPIKKLSIAYVRRLLNPVTTTGNVLRTYGVYSCMYTIPS